VHERHARAPLRFVQIGRGHQDRDAALERFSI
jgi:hypothetical protein